MHLLGLRPAREGGGNDQNAQYISLRIYLAMIRIFGKIFGWIFVQILVSRELSGRLDIRRVMGCCEKKDKLRCGEKK